MMDSSLSLGSSLPYPMPGGAILSFLGPFDRQAAASDAVPYGTDVMSLPSVFLGDYGHQR
jgi:hypothetical protein